MPTQRLSDMPEAFKCVLEASPPLGVVQNLENPESRSYQVYIVSAVLVALSISFILFSSMRDRQSRDQEPWDNC